MRFALDGNNSITNESIAPRPLCHSSKNYVKDLIMLPPGALLEKAACKIHLDSVKFLLDKHAASNPATSRSQICYPSSKGQENE